MAIAFRRQRALHLRPVLLQSLALRLKTRLCGFLKLLVLHLELRHRKNFRLSRVARLGRCGHLLIRAFLGILSNT